MRTSVWGGKEHNPMRFGNNRGILDIMLSEHICLFHDQATHRMRNEYDGILANRDVIFPKPMGEDQHLKEKVFGKVDDIEVGSNALEIGVVPVGEYPV